MDAAGPAPYDAEVASPVRSAAFKAAVAICLLWWAGLTGMALFVSNPEPLSRVQIENSSAVVTAVWSSEKSRQVDVTRVWTGSAKKGPLTLLNLNELKMVPGVPYILPLTALQARPATTARVLAVGTKARPRIYRETTQAVDQLKAVLKYRARGG